MTSHEQARIQFFGRSLRRQLFALAFLMIEVTVIPAAQAQTYSVLHNFTGGSDGSRPQATLAIDRAGNLYGTAPQGGTSDYGTVFKLTRYGSNFIFNPLYNFHGQYDGGAPIGPVTIAADGTLYGTTIEGGYFGGAFCSNGGCGTVFRLTPPPTTPPSPFTPWHETALYAFQAASDGMAPYSPQLIFDQAGNLYGTTYQGGSDFGVVFAMTPYGDIWAESVLYNGFAPGFPGQNPISGVVRDNAGNFYGTASIGGAGGDGVVYELSLTQYGWVETVLHSFDNGADGGLPYGGLVMDSVGNLYGATQAGSHGAVVYELSPSNGGWNFQVLYHFASGVGPNAALTLDAAGNLYGTTEDVGAHGAGMVFKLTNANGVWTLADLHDFSTGSGSYPYGGVTLDASGNLYGTTSDGGANGWGVVWKITP